VVEFGLSKAAHETGRVATRSVFLWVLMLPLSRRPAKPQCRSAATTDGHQHERGLLGLILGMTIFEEFGLCATVGAQLQQY
jgi:hypothetical protein